MIDTRDFCPKNVVIHGFQIPDLVGHGYDPRPDLRVIADQVAMGAYRVPVEAVLPLEQAARAHELLEGPAAWARSFSRPWTDTRDTDLFARRWTRLSSAWSRRSLLLLFVHFQNLSSRRMISARVNWRHDVR
jgi:hypothetical protein